MTPSSRLSAGTTRREFLQRSTATLVSPALLSASSHPRSDPLRLGLVGCGRQGVRDAVSLLVGDDQIRLVALADVFDDAIESAHHELSKDFGERIDVPQERRFVGFDACERLLSEDCDLVVLATPPAFRPGHFEQAVAKRKHVFLEKPVAVDASGVRRVLAAADQAEEAGLKVAVGFHRRHASSNLETVPRVRAGEIGELQYLRAYANSSGVWRAARQPNWSELQYQIRNWYYFTWLSGDFIVEELVDQIDVALWIVGELPTEAQGQGGRMVRTGPEYGQIYDHYSVEYTFGNGVRLFAQARQQEFTVGERNEYAHGSKGVANLGDGHLERTDGTAWTFEGARADGPRRQSHAWLRAVREDLPFAEATRAAEATMVAILGRQAAQVGAKITYDNALAYQTQLCPSVDELSLEHPAPVQPNADGTYPVTAPGMRGSR